MDSDNLRLCKIEVLVALGQTFVRILIGKPFHFNFWEFYTYLTEKSQMGDEINQAFGSNTYTADTLSSVTHSECVQLEWHYPETAI
jgi:hypothetical protein